MKKLTLMCSILLIAACTPKVETIETKTISTFKESIKEKLEEPESAIIDEIETMYSNDSLCIIHANLTAKNKLGQESTIKLEYIYLIAEQNSYEVYFERNTDFVYMSPLLLEAEKKGELYESLTYDDAIRYLASLKIMKDGRKVGDKIGLTVKIPLALNVGSWKKRQFVDEFNEKTNDSYLFLESDGVFSNSATTNSESEIYFYVTSNSISFRLIEYSSHLVKDYGAYDMTIKDANGNIKMFHLHNRGNGDMYFNDYYGRSKQEAEFKQILEQEGSINCLIEKSSGYSYSKYIYKIHLAGYNEALSLL